VTEAIDGLERDGLVERTPDPNDRRAKLIQITAKGIEACARTEPLRERIIAQTFGILDQTERDALAAILAKMADGLARDPA
jgi:DNA-binding MarR family transcriptional regulator